jgi:hypothetical protein
MRTNRHSRTGWRAAQPSSWHMAGLRAPPRPCPTPIPYAFARAPSIRSPPCSLALSPSARRSVPSGCLASLADVRVGTGRGACAALKAVRPPRKESPRARRSLCRAAGGGRWRRRRSSTALPGARAVPGTGLAAPRRGISACPRHCCRKKPSTASRPPPFAETPRSLPLVCRVWGRARTRAFSRRSPIITPRPAPRARAAFFELFRPRWATGHPPLRPPLRRRRRRQILRSRACRRLHARTGRVRRRPRGERGSGRTCSSGETVICGAGGRYVDRQHSGPAQKRLRPAARVPQPSGAAHPAAHVGRGEWA